MSTPPIYPRTASFQPQPTLPTSQAEAQGARPKKRIQRVEDSSVDSAPITQVTRRVRKLTPPKTKFNWSEMIDKLNKLAVEDCGESDSGSETSPKPAGAEGSDSEPDVPASLIQP